jgi:hypothetical protein
MVLVLQRAYAMFLVAYILGPCIDRDGLFAYVKFISLDNLAVSTSCFFSPIF